MASESLAHSLPDITQIEGLVRAALEEDGAFRDVTTRSLVPVSQRGRGAFLAKGNGVLCGLPVAAAAFRVLDPAIELKASISDGAWVENGTVFATIEGPLASVLSAERVALNHMQRLSGIATLTRQTVDAVQGFAVKVLDTRKTTPGLRLLERYAVRVGGATNHRFNLSDGILIKDNHIAAGRARGLSIAGTVALARQSLPPALRIEIEVTTLEEAREAVEAGAEVILLDNMTPALMAECVALAKGRALTEASGGVTIENIREIAATGVDYISSGALTHSAPSLDISLNLETV